MNDPIILFFLFILFIGLGGLMPIVNEAYYTPSYNHTLRVNGTDIQNDMPNTSNIFSAGKILLSIISMFFWTFGGVPWWLDLVFFEPLRILLYVLIYRQFRSGGG